MGRNRNAFGFKTGRAGIKCYRAAGRMFGQTFSSGRAAPEIKATCCKCGDLCYVRLEEHAVGGVSKVPCYGCVKDSASLRAV